VFLKKFYERDTFGEDEREMIVFVSSIDYDFSTGKSECAVGIYFV